MSTWCLPKPAREFAARSRLHRRERPFSEPTSQTTARRHRDEPLARAAHSTALRSSSASPSISVGTVKSHTSQLLAKLGVDNRVQITLLVHGATAPMG
jgi:hypothetical protein